jgi:preprotein translocase subunit SecY
VRDRLAMQSSQMFSRVRIFPQAHKPTDKGERYFICFPLIFFFVMMNTPSPYVREEKDISANAEQIFHYIGKNLNDEDR